MSYLKYIGLLSFAFILSACSAGSDIQTEGSNPSAGDIDKQVMDHFLNGADAESKGDFNSAINEYSQALELKKDPGIYYVLAKNYFFLNKLSFALEYSRTSVELSPDMSEYKMLLADIYTTANMPDSAVTVLEQIIDKDSSDISALYKLARLYEKNKPSKAIEIYNKITAIAGPEWSVMLHIAELYEKMGNLNEAAGAVEQLLTIDPSNITVQKMLADLYVKAKNYDKALLLLQDIIELTPDDLDARERKASVYIEQGMWDKAAKEYDYILKQDVPLDAKIRIGVTYFQKSLTDSTLTPVAKDFFETIDKDTLDWRVKMYLGAIAMNEGNDSLAMDIFKQVTSLASWHPDAWVQLGGLYFDNKRYEDAVTLMKQAIESFPENFAINLILGLSLAQTGKSADAKPYLKKAVDLNPDDLNAISAYAFTLSQLKENQEAEIYLKKALKQNPDDVNLLGALGLIYDNEERWGECDSVYERALQVDSTNALVNNNYAYSLSERGLQLERALAMVKVAIAAEPENSSYLDTIGWIYFKLGIYDQAKSYLEQAIKIGGEKPVMLEHLGDVVYKSGQKSAAMELWEKAFNLDKSNLKLKEKIEKGEI